MAIFALAYSDTFDKAQRVPNIETTSPMHPSDHGIPDDVVYDKVSQDLEALSTDIPPEGSSLKHPQWVPRFDRWVYICVLAGSLCGLWSPLSTLGMSGEGSVSNPYVVLFVFMSGQVVVLRLFESVTVE